MNTFKRISAGLRSKLLVSHFLVALVGSLTFFVAVSIVAPFLFGSLMSGAMNPNHLMTMGETMDLARGAFAEAIFYSLLAAALAAVGTAAVASLFVSRRIVGPLGRMADATRRISDGRYDERVPVEENDELGSLSQSFNAMASVLQETGRQRSEFIADVSHELRTPLSTLQGYMEGLIDGVIEPSEETWGLLYTEAERMRRLVDDLQQLSQAEAGQLTLHARPTSSVEAVKRSTESMLPLFAEKEVTLECEISEDRPRIVADADRVVQILTNLLRNALRYTPSGGQVTVESVASGGEVHFTVTDTGAGIAPEHLPHVFERFYRVEKSRSREGGGSGVGLAISRALVEAMGGRIRVGSAGLGKGASFSFTLPAAHMGS
ncbi:MAG: ATP-binding protein [Rubrobacteraceae bacterium]